MAEDSNPSNEAKDNWSVIDNWITANSEALAAICRKWRSFYDYFGSLSDDQVFCAVVERVYRIRDKYDTSLPIQPFVNGVAKRVVLQLVSRRWPRHSPSPSDSWSGPVGQTTSILSRACATAASILLYEKLSLLGPVELFAIMDHVYDGRTFEEIATSLNAAQFATNIKTKITKQPFLWTAAAVKTRYEAGIEILRSDRALRAAFLPDNVATSSLTAKKVRRGSRNKNGSADPSTRGLIDPRRDANSESDWNGTDGSQSNSAGNG